MDYKAQNAVYGELQKSFPARPEDLRFYRYMCRGGDYYLVPVGIANPADYLYYVPTPEEQKTSQGFGGSTLSFTLVDGEEIKVRGPWHSNSKALFGTTGLDIRDLHLTAVAVYLNGVLLYKDAAPVLGEFDRGEKLAKAFARLYDKEVDLIVASSGGGSMKGVQP